MSHSNSAMSISLLVVFVSGPSLLEASGACDQVPANCQAYDGATERTISDRGVLMEVLDDFVPLNSTISSLCVWGQFVDTDPQAAQADCSGQSGPDQFEVTIYVRGENDLPGFNGWGPVTASAIRTPVTLSRGTSGAAQIFQFELTLDTPITDLFTDGTRLWLSVTNRSESATAPHCHWHWSQLSTSSGEGNHYSAKGAYFFHFPNNVDYAFCLDAATGESGDVLHPCCNCDGQCTITSVADCDASGGRWHVNATTCAGIACAAGPPANDLCANMQPVPPFEGLIIDTACSGTDGPTQVPTELGTATVGNDLWFSLVNEFACQLSFDFCASDFDSVISVYFDPSNPNQCPCPTDDTLLIGASDEDCAGGSAVGAGGYVSPVSTNNCPEEAGCYTIRISGFEGALGEGYLWASCAPVPAATPVIHLPEKSRFITITAPVSDPCDESSDPNSAIRIGLSALHHVSPPYTASPSIPFTAFEGEVRWVGPPAQYVETQSSGITFLASKLRCDPHYQDWTSVGRLHITGSAIVPSSTYTVQFVPSLCMGNEENCPAASFPATVRTTRWADVEIPWNPPSTTAQPDVGDIAFLINRFRAHLVDSFKARAMLVGSDQFGNINIAPELSFAHVAACVDAFRGLGYPHQIEPCP